MIMAAIFYGVLLAISLIVIVYLAGKGYDNMDIRYWSIVVLIPLILLGYWLTTRVTTGESALICYCFIYLDSTVLLAVVLFCITNFMGITVKPWIKIAVYILAFSHLALVWTSLYNKLYYASVKLVDTGMGIAPKMTKGPLWFLHLIYLALVILAIIGLIVLAYIKKGTYSRRTLMLYTILLSAGIVIYGAETILDVDFSTLPALYVVADIAIAMNYDHAHTHDIAGMVAVQRKNHSNVGYAAVDMDTRFLSCNQKMYDFFPELAMQIVDAHLEEGSKYAALFYERIEDFRQGNTAPKKIQAGELVYQCDIMEFSLLKNGKPQGYLFELRDVTEKEKNLKIMHSYNQSLNAEVKKKTENIIGIQQKVVLGLANMVENRDSNTGGHVKRTSDIIRFVVREIQKTGVYEIDEQYAQDIIRAAPMHDLGKITVENAILNKPGKLNDEEYEIMKSHSIKSGEFVHLIIDGVEEQHFVDVAFHVARYHHERWDGRGYPEGLVGEMIPLEARIMAIADVYDALVSKRIYKPPMPFENAARIMIEGMGTQFDPKMKMVFMGCRKDLEQYYSNIR